jgi:hypothetical protein
LTDKNYITISKTSTILTDEIKQLLLDMGYNVNPIKTPFEYNPISSQNFINETYLLQVLNVYDYATGRIDQITWIFFYINNNSPYTPVPINNNNYLSSVYFNNKVYNTFIYPYVTEGNIVPEPTQNIYDKYIDNIDIQPKQVFNVIGYFNSDLALNKFFKTASSHLKKSGIFIFDFWHTPAIKYIKPNQRIKYFYHKNFCIKKISKPRIISNNSINIKFDFIYKINSKKMLNSSNKKNFVQIKQKSGKEDKKIELYPNSNFSFSENHKIRHFSIKELVFYANKYGMSYVSSYAMLKNNLPSKKYWSSCIIFQKI